MKPLKCKTLGVNLSVECKQNVKNASYCKVCLVHDTIVSKKSIAADWCLCWYVLIGDHIGFWQYVFDWYGLCCNTRLTECMDNTLKVV